MLVIRMRCVVAMLTQTPIHAQEANVGRLRRTVRNKDKEAEM